MVRIFSLVSLLIAGGAAFGQAGVDVPKPYPGLAPTIEERDQRESLYRHAWGRLLCERR